MTVMAGSVKPANVSVYRKLMAVPVTSGVQFGFGHPKVAKNSAELTAVAVVAVSDSVNGSTRCPPGLVQVPVNVDVTDRFTVAFVFPTPSIAVPVQVTVRPLSVHTWLAGALRVVGALRGVVEVCHCQRRRRRERDD